MSMSDTTNFGLADSAYCECGELLVDGRCSTELDDPPGGPSPTVTSPELREVESPGTKIRTKWERLLDDDEVV